MQTQTSTQQPDLCIGMTEISKRTGISSLTIVGLIKKGELRGAKIGKHWLVRESELQRFLEQKFGSEAKEEMQAA